MLNTVKATLSPSGTLVFEEEVHLTQPVPVLVTLLEDQPAEIPRKTLRQMDDNERAAFLAEMREYWRHRLSSSDEFAMRKQEEIDLENRRWEQGR